MVFDNPSMNRPSSSRHTPPQAASEHRVQEASSVFNLMTPGLGGIHLITWEVIGMCAGPSILFWVSKLLFKLKIDAANLRTIESGLMSVLLNTFSFRRYHIRLRVIAKCCVHWVFVPFLWQDRLSSSHVISLTFHVCGNCLVLRTWLQIVCSAWRSQRAWRIVL